MTITAPEMFQEMAPQAPLPWREHKFRRGIIVDAKGEAVCYVDGSDPDWRNITSMIVVAVNTCGGFKAEIVAPADSSRVSDMTKNRKSKA